MFYILSITFGTAMDSLYVQFYMLATGGTLHLSTGWVGVAISTLDGWKWFYRSFVICVIAVFVWLGENLVMDVDYGRQSKY
jgi:hypothetical protein